MDSFSKQWLSEKSKKTVIYGIIITVFVVIIYYLIKAVSGINKTNQTLTELNDQDVQVSEEPVTSQPTQTPTQTPTPTIPPTLPPGGTPPPLEYIAPYCGKDTIFNQTLNQCVYYAENGSDSLSTIFNNIKDKLIVSNINGDNTLIVRDKPVANVSTINKPKPNWFAYWDEQGRYEANKLLSGSDIRGDGINCSCGDCATWRGGNAGTCIGENGDGNPRGDIRRVACDTNYDSNKCVCAYPYTPIGGLCVIPYKYNPDVDHRPCCSSCVYEENCVGKEECKGLCEEQLVEYPGIRYRCSNDLVVEEAGEEAGESFRKITQQELDNKCVVDNDYFGKNEYQCAYECTDTQINCSKRCLPKLWKWEKLMVGNTLVGYTQSDDIIQFEPNTTKTEYCPIGDISCQPTTPVTEDDMQNCGNCTDCFWELNDITHEYEYSCNNCEQCITNKPTGVDENGFRTFEKIKCNDVNNCRGCTEIFDPTQSRRNTITCNFCNSSPDSCIVDEHSKIQNQNTTNLKTYNQGSAYDPTIYSLWNSWYSGNDFALAAACGAHGGSSNCSTDLKMVNGEERQGYTEGGSLGVFDIYRTDCTGKRSNCSIPNPPGNENDSIKPTCYSTKYYGQMNKDLDCQKLQLPSSYEVDENDNEIVSEGVAEGLSKDACVHYFCNKWNWTNDEWTPTVGDECDTICEPNLYKGYLNIPEFATPGEQIDYLKFFGKK